MNPIVSSWNIAKLGRVPRPKAGRWCSMEVNQSFRDGRWNSWTLDTLCTSNPAGHLLKLTEQLKFLIGCYGDFSGSKHWYLYNDVILLCSLQTFFELYIGSLFFSVR
jgi:hypothetical protein